MEKKGKNSNGIFYVVISLALVIGIVGAVNAGVSFKQLLAKEVAPLIAPKIVVDLDLDEPTEQEPSFGAMPGGDIFQPITFYDKFGYGEGRNKTEYFYKAINFTDATNTAVVWKAQTDGYNDFYLSDLWIENTKKSTSTVRICVTTSTASVIAKDDVAYLDGDTGTCTIIRTLSNAFGADGAAYDGKNATSSQFGLLEYPGTDTRVANSELNFLVNSTTYFLVFATSTNDGAILASGNVFDGKLHLIGRESNR